MVIDLASRRRLPAAVVTRTDSATVLEFRPRVSFADQLARAKAERANARTGVDDQLDFAAALAAEEGVTLTELLTRALALYDATPSAERSAVLD